MDKIKINDLQVIDSLEKEDQIIVLDASNSSGNSRPDKRATLTQLGDLIHSYMDLDDFYFQSSFNNSVERTITQKLQETYSVLDYDIDNTGTVNCIQNVRTLVKQVGESGGGKIIFKPGDYIFTPDSDGYGVQILWDNITIELEAGARLHLVDPNRYMRARGANASGLFHVGGAVPGYSYFRNVNENTWGFDHWNYYEDPRENTDFGLISPPYVTENITRGDTSIKVNDASAISAGDWIYLRTNDIFIRPTNPHETIRTEILRVRSVDTNTNTIYTDLHPLDDYDVESDPNLYCAVIPLRLVNNVHFTGHGEIIGEAYVSEADLPNNGEGETGICFDYHMNGSVSGINIRLFPNAQVRHGLGVNFSADGLTLEGYRMPNQDGSPKRGYYGLTGRGTLYTRYNNILGRNLRNTCDTGIANLLSRVVHYQNIQSVGNHTHGVTTHSVVNCIMDTITVKDSAGGMSFRGINLIANNIDIQGVNQDMTSPGGITIGEYEGGPNGD